MKIIPLKQGSPEWSEWKRSGIGSSDIAAIMGFSPWGNAHKVLEKKLGIADEFSNHAMQRGVRFEEEARKAFENLVDNDYPSACVEHTDTSYYIASLDGYCKKNNQLLEIKIPLAKNFPFAKEIPKNYIYQCQWQLMVTGAKDCALFFYCPETRACHVTTILPDQKIWDAMQNCADKFWKAFQEGNPLAEKASVVINDTEDLSGQYAVFDEMEKAAKKGKESIRDRIISHGNGSSFNFGRLICTITSPRDSYDLVAMKEALSKQGIDVNQFKKQSKEEPTYTIRIRKDD